MEFQVKLSYVSLMWGDSCLWLRDLREFEREKPVVFFFFLNGFTISREVTAALLAGQFCDMILEVVSEKQSSNDSDACDKDEEVKKVLECWL